MDKSIMKVTQKIPVFLFNFVVDQFNLNFTVEASDEQKAKEVLATALTKITLELQEPDSKGENEKSAEEQQKAQETAK